jgi:hypothetical protein
MRLAEYIEQGIHSVITQEKSRQRLTEGLERATALPLVSVGPSGIGGAYQREYFEREVLEALGVSRDKMGRPGPIR